jgi:CHAT domain-containing protein
LALNSIDALETRARKVEGLWREGNWRGALDGYCALFRERWNSLAENGESLTAADLTILERIADLAVPFGQYKAADQLLETAVKGYDRLGGTFWADLVTIKRVQLAFSNLLPYEARIILGTRRATLGDVETMEFTAEGFTRWESSYRQAPDTENKSLLFSHLYLVLGRLLMQLGLYRSALEAFDRGTLYAGARRWGSIPSTWTHLRLAVAQCLLEKGELRDSSVELRRILRRVEEKKHPGHLTTALEIQAKLDLLQGDFGSAQKHLLRVWYTCRERGFVAPALRSFLNLAQLLILLNKTFEAKTLLAAARSEPDLLKDGRLVAQVEKLLRLADARSTSSIATAPSVRSLQEDSTLVATNQSPRNTQFKTETPGLGFDAFEERALQFYWYLALGDWSAVQKCLARLDTFHSSESRLVQLDLKILKATAEYYRGQLGDADAGFRAARAELLELGLLPQRWQLQVLWKRCLDKLNVSPDERASLAAENDSLLEHMGNSLPLHDRIVFLLNKPTQEEEELARLIWPLQDLDSVKSSGIFERLRHALSKWRGLNRLIERIYRQRESLALLAVKGSAPQHEWPRIPLWRRILFCTPKRASLLFLSLPDSVFVARLGWISIKYSVARVSRQRVREFVKTWHESVSLARPDVARRISRTLSNELGINSLLDELPHRVTALTILPDDALHGFPFAAVEHRGKYLPERFALSVAYQLGSPNRSTRRPIRAPRALLVGIPAGHPELPKTVDQIGLVRTWLTGRKIAYTELWNRCATPEKVKHAMQHASLFHVSCHGDFVQGRPEATGLRLMDSTGADGILSLPELFDLDLSKIKLAVLMSCWGADNFILPGRWIISLPEVLWRSGTQSVVASLWEVSEDCAIAFVGNFYSALAKLPVDRALQTAQITAIQNSARDNIDPVDWAGFQVYGNPNRLQI